jgi:hypothetical protein
VVGMLMRQMPWQQGTVGLFRHRKPGVEHPAAEPTAIASTAYDEHSYPLTVIRQYITPPDGSETHPTPLDPLSTMPAETMG